MPGSRGAAAAAARQVALRARRRLPRQRHVPVARRAKAATEPTAEDDDTAPRAPGHTCQLSAQRIPVRQKYLITVEKVKSFMHLSIAGKTCRC